MTVAGKPERYHTVNPYIVVPDADRLAAFLKKAFEGEVVARIAGSDGSIMHLEVEVGDSVIMMGQSKGEPRLCSLYLYVADTDSTHAAALEAGATSIMEPADRYYGDRNAGVKNPAGNLWWIATRKEELSPEELQRRAAAKE